MLSPEGVPQTASASSQADKQSTGTNPPPADIAVLPDTPDTRLLVALTSHAHDLSEARHSLGSAFDAGEASNLWEPLTSHAVTAYVRPFIHSNVRVRLDQMSEFPGVPAELMATHEMIRNYRNTTIAHSQSDLVMPLPVALLNEAGEVLRVLGMSVIHPMPRVIAERFDQLLSTMEAIVDDATRPVLERLRTWAQADSPEAIRRWQEPEITHSYDHDFTATRRRKRNPGFTYYWHVEQD